MRLREFSPADGAIHGQVASRHGIAVDVEGSAVPFRNW
jgi:hypothetical protein